MEQINLLSGTDRDLVVRYQAGDSRAALILFDRWKGWILKSYSKVRGFVEREDYLQEAYIQTIKALKWIKVEVIKDDHWRFTHSLGFFLRDLNKRLYRGLPKSDSSEAEVADSGPGPEEEAERRLLLGMLQKTLSSGRLSPRHIRLVRLRFFEEQSQEACAKALGISRTRVQQLQEQVLSAFRGLFMENLTVA